VAGYRTLGSLPQSHGCVRLTDEAALWCYENLPMDTRVVVF
jgi:lipoprotein-anchoring transpeptidase ErfK/SrfK